MRTQSSLLLLLPPTVLGVAPLLQDNVNIVNVVGRNDANPNTWVDSYSVGDECYCLSTFDHAIGSIVVEIPTLDVFLTVEEVCSLLGPGPGATDRPVYNDIQCGNGPANNFGDETDCPGRVDHGIAGCGHIGPKWNLSNFALETTTDGTVVVVNPPLPIVPTFEGPPRRAPDLVVTLGIDPVFEGPPREAPDLVVTLGIDPVFEGPPREAPGLIVNTEQQLDIIPVNNQDTTTDETGVRLPDDSTDTGDLPAPILLDVTLRLDLEGDDNAKTDWASSYSVGDTCYCLPGLTAAVATTAVDTPVGILTIQEVCDRLGPGPGPDGRPLFNDVQCGHGPADTDSYENTCPGRVEYGARGCRYIGPTWNFGAMPDTLNSMDVATESSTDSDEQNNFKFWIFWIQDTVDEVVRSVRNAFK